MRKYKIIKGLLIFGIIIVSILICFTLFIGMVLDANIDFGDPMGFLSLRILFPILAMGLCILHELRRGSSR